MLASLDHTLSPTNNIPLWAAASQSAVEMPSGRGPNRGPGTMPPSLPPKVLFYLPAARVPLRHAPTPRTPEARAGAESPGRPALILPIIVCCLLLLLPLLLLFTWERELVGKVWVCFPAREEMRNAVAWCISAGPCVACARACRLYVAAGGEGVLSASLAAAALLPPLRHPDHLDTCQKRPAAVSAGRGAWLSWLEYLRGLGLGGTWPHRNNEWHILIATYRQGDYSSPLSHLL